MYLSGPVKVEGNQDADQHLFHTKQESKWGMLGVRKSVSVVIKAGVVFQ